MVHSRSDGHSLDDIAAALDTALSDGPTPETGAADRRRLSDLCKELKDILHALAARIHTGDAADCVSHPAETSSKGDNGELHRRLADVVARIETTAAVDLVDLAAVTSAARLYADVLGRERLPLLTLAWAFLDGMEHQLSVWFGAQWSAATG